ncbi:MAG: hypothetical protein ACRCV3_04635 [Desulfovibrionaceae bacterium]
MNNTVTQLLYNMILSRGNAKDVASKLSVNYATLMRELNIYDNNAKLGIERFLHIINILEDTAPLEYIVNLFGFKLVDRTEHADFNPADPLLINNLLIHIQNNIISKQEKEKLSAALQKPYTRIMKEVNIYDPNAKLGIETFLTILLFTKDLQTLFLFIEISGYSIISQKTI